MPDPSLFSGLPRVRLFGGLVRQYVQFGRSKRGGLTVTLDSGRTLYGKQAQAYQQRAQAAKAKQPVSGAKQPQQSATWEPFSPGLASEEAALVRRAQEKLGVTPEALRVAAVKLAALDRMPPSYAHLAEAAAYFDTHVVRGKPIRGTYIPTAPVIQRAAAVVPGLARSRDQSPSAAPGEQAPKPAAPSVGLHVQRALDLAANADPNSKWAGQVVEHVNSIRKLPRPQLTAIARGLGVTSPKALLGGEATLMAIQDQIERRIKARRDNPARLLSERPRFFRRFCGAVACGQPGCEVCPRKMADEVAVASAPAVPTLEPVDNVEIFEVGNHRGKDYSAADLDAIVANFDRLSDPSLPEDQRLLRPTVVIGHEEAGEQPLTNTGWPAAGIVTKLWRAGTKLMANFGDVVPLVAQLLRQKSYRTVSAEIYDDFEYQGQHYGLALRRVALLGGELPQVKTLADIPLATYADQPGGKVFRTFYEIRPMPAVAPRRVFQGANGKWYWTSQKVQRFAESCVRKDCESNPNQGGRPTPGPCPKGGSGQRKPAEPTGEERKALIARAIAEDENPFLRSTRFLTLLANRGRKPRAPRPEPVIAPEHQQIAHEARVAKLVLPDAVRAARAAAAAARPIVAKYQRGQDLMTRHWKAATRSSRLHYGRGRQMVVDTQEQIGGVQQKARDLATIVAEHRDTIAKAKALGIRRVKGVRLAECVHKACESNPNFGGQPTPGPCPTGSSAGPAMPQQFDTNVPRPATPAGAAATAQPSTLQNVGAAAVQGAKIVGGLGLAGLKLGKFLVGEGLGQVFGKHGLPAHILSGYRSGDPSMHIRDQLGAAIGPGLLAGTGKWALHNLGRLGRGLWNLARSNSEQARVRRMGEFARKYSGRLRKACESNPNFGGQPTPGPCPQSGGRIVQKSTAAKTTAKQKAPTSTSPTDRMLGSIAKLRALQLNIAHPSLTPEKVQRAVASATKGMSKAGLDLAGAKFQVRRQRTKAAAIAALQQRLLESHQRGFGETVRKACESNPNFGGQPTPGPCPVGGSSGPAMPQQFDTNVPRPAPNPATQAVAGPGLLGSIGGFLGRAGKLALAGAANTVALAAKPLGSILGAASSLKQEQRDRGLAPYGLRNIMTRWSAVPTRALLGLGTRTNSYDANLKDVFHPSDSLIGQAVTAPFKVARGVVRGLGYLFGGGTLQEAGLHPWRSAAERVRKACESNPNQGGQSTPGPCPKGQRQAALQDFANQWNAAFAKYRQANKPSWAGRLLGKVDDAATSAVGRAVDLAGYLGSGAAQAAKVVGRGVAKLLGGRKQPTVQHSERIRKYAWRPDPTERSPTRITSDTGEHEYGSQAQKIMAQQQSRASKAAGAAKAAAGATVRGAARGARAVGRGLVASAKLAVTATKEGAPVISEAVREYRKARAAGSGRAKAIKAGALGAVEGGLNKLGRWLQEKFTGVSKDLHNALKPELGGVGATAANLGAYIPLKAAAYTGAYKLAPAMMSVLGTGAGTVAAIGTGLGAGMGAYYGVRYAAPLVARALRRIGAPQAVAAAGRGIQAIFGNPGPKRREGVLAAAPFLGAAAARATAPVRKWAKGRGAELLQSAQNLVGGVGNIGEWAARHGLKIAGARLAGATRALGQIFRGNVAKAGRVWRAAGRLNRGEWQRSIGEGGAAAGALVRNTASVVGSTLGTLKDAVVGGAKLLARGAKVAGPPAWKATKAILGAGRAAISGSLSLAGRAAGATARAVGAGVGAVNRRNRLARPQTAFQVPVMATAAPGQIPPHAVKIVQHSEKIRRYACRLARRQVPFLVPA